MKIGTIKLVRWWPMRKRLPRGWRIARQRPTHHSRYSVLIERAA